MPSPLQSFTTESPTWDRRLLAVTMAALLLYWMFDAAIDAGMYQPQSFAASLLTPSFHELVDRMLVIVLLVCLVGYCRRFSAARSAYEKTVKEALLRAEHERAKLEALVEAMGDAVSIQDPQLMVLYQNRAHKELMGAHEGEKCHLAYRDQSQVCHGCHLVEAFNDGAIHRAEVSTQTADGRRFFEITASVARNQSGQVTAGIELVRDITDRKLVEHGARQQAALLQHLIDTIPNPIYYQDQSGRFVWCNQAFASWLAKPRELLIGRAISQVAPPHVARPFLQPTPEGGCVDETSVVQGDGERREFIFYKSMFINDGESRGVVGVIVDISARKRAEEEICGLNAALRQQAIELRQVNRELEGFSHAISHDLRTPLTRIYSCAQLLYGYRDLLDADGVNYLNAVNEGCQQVEALLNALMGLAKVAEVDLILSDVDLSSLVTEKANELRLGEPQRGVDFRIAPHLVVQGDRQLLQIAIDNLVANAWKYTSKATEAVIEAGSFTSNDGDTVFYIRDNGAGFDSSRTGELFKPFRRLHASHEFPGTGLGLATVRRIIRRHNGRVWAESSPGCGATFYFTLNG